jgi:hypothetical protein
MILVGYYDELKPLKFYGITDAGEPKGKFEEMEWRKVDALTMARRAKGELTEDEEIELQQRNARGGCTGGD